MSGLERHPVSIKARDLRGGMPFADEAWIDMVTRAKAVFRYTADGPKGLVKGETAYVIVVSGGTVAGGDVDFAWSLSPSHPGLHRHHRRPSHRQQL